MPFNLGGPEVLVILVIVLIVFGAGRLPNVMRDLGSGVREFKKAQTEADTNTPTVGTTHASSAAPAPASAASTVSAPSTPDTASRPKETSARA